MKGQDSMNRSQQKRQRMINIILAIGDSVVYIISLFLAYFVRYGYNFDRIFPEQFHLVFWVTLIGFLLIQVGSSTYDLTKMRKPDLVVRLVMNQFLTVIVMMSLTAITDAMRTPRWVLLLYFVFSSILIVTWRLVARRLLLRFIPRQRIAVIGFEKDIDTMLQQHPNFGFDGLISHIIIGDFYYNLRDHIKEYDAVYLKSAITDADEKKIKRLLIRNNKGIISDGDTIQLTAATAGLISNPYVCLLERNGFERASTDRFLKRMIDLLISLPLAIVMAPVVAISWLILKLQSNDPVFQKTELLTVNEQVFYHYKFNSDIFKKQGSIADLEQTGEIEADTSEQPKNWIASLHLTHVPELFSVVKGSMSIVGPSPEQPFFANQFKSQVPDYFLRFKAKPGLIHPVDILGFRAKTVEQKLKYDLYYIKNFRPRMDAVLILQWLARKFMFKKSKMRAESTVRGITLEEAESDSNYIVLH